MAIWELWLERSRLRRGERRRAFELVRASWEAFGRHDPMWAIVSDPKRRNNAWDSEAFFSTGRGKVERLLNALHEVGLEVGRDRVLDFGCGLGRLTQALAAHFSRVEGVDISRRMIEQARALNRHGERVHYHLGQIDRLPFASAQFDAVFSTIVLQHVGIDYQRIYVREFIRVLRPGGLAIFQAVARALEDSGTRFESPVETPDGTFTIDMNVFPRADVEQAIALGGGQLLHALPDTSAGDKYESLLYVVSRPS